MTSYSRLDLKTGTTAISVQQHMEAECVHVVCVCELRGVRVGKWYTSNIALLNSILMETSLPI